MSQKFVVLKLVLKKIEKKAKRFHLQIICEKWLSEMPRKIY